MLKSRISQRTLIFGIFTFLAVTGAALWFSPQSEAVGCTGPHGGTDHSGMTSTWVLTPEAQLRTSLGEDCTDPNFSVCREECLQTCGDAVPTGRFACFAN